eukprot:8215830-Alexandrium_andersonii.AAC.1
MAPRRGLHHLQQTLRQPCRRSDVLQRSSHLDLALIARLTTVDIDVACDHPHAFPRRQTVEVTE